MKKHLLPIIGSLIIGGIATGGTMYAVKTIKYNNQVERLKVELRNQINEAQNLINQITGHLNSIASKNKEINDELDNLKSRTEANFNEAKELYKKAVALTTYTVKDTEKKDVNYYLAYLDTEAKEVKAFASVTTQFKDKQQAIPSDFDQLLEISGFKVEGKEIIKAKEDFSKETFVTKDSKIVKIIDEIVKVTQQGGQKLIEFFQEQLNDLTNLKKDLTTLDEDGFFKVLKEFEKTLEKDAWVKSPAKEKLVKIKGFLTNIKSEWNLLSGAITSKILPELRKLDEQATAISNRIKNDGENPPSRQ
ncbi:hypothetical protein [Mycoplasma yeatsii]|uniref:hypothetical protein n=1 Tax=Mycoplasma yeatsii TaxID=51365 RepID=UPI0005B246BA|nr:hypothetical protein [Mycoplasma yeatsii]AJM72010.1 membrane protein [Mycoplasma yeatsii GM274B]